MPIYEFYCQRCHTVFSFLARSAGKRRKPACPRCGAPRLPRLVSTFAVAAGRPDAPGDGADDGLPPGIDESRLEQAMEQIAAEADSAAEDDPRAMAGLMRRFYSSSGLRLGDAMAEAIDRLEAGEDPDRIEKELGGLLETEDPLALADGSGGGGARVRDLLRRRLRPPRVDRTLYDL